MKKKLIALHILTALSALLYLAVVLFGDKACGNYGCGEAGLVFAPLLLPLFILGPVTIIVDLTVLGRRFAPHNYKHFMSRLIPAALVAAIVLICSTLAIFSYRQDHYSVNKTLKIIQNCQAASVDYNGTDIYLSTTPSAGNASDIKVPGSGHLRVAQAIKDSAAKCRYDLRYNNEGFYIDSSSI